MIRLMYLPLIIVTLFASGVSWAATSCPQSMQEFNKGVLQGYFKSWLREAYGWSRPKDVCLCSVGVVALSWSSGGGIVPSKVEKTTFVYTSPEDPLFPQDSWLRKINKREGDRWLDNYLKVNGKCPSTLEEFEQVAALVVAEKNDYVKAAELKEREEEDIKNTERARRKNEVKKFCNGVPTIKQELIEFISSKIKVDPTSIRLNRVNESHPDGLSCVATFYTPKGVATAYVGFDLIGGIDYLREISFPK